MTALIFTGDVEDKLQRLQWISRLSSWRPFRFCVPPHTNMEYRCRHCWVGADTTAEQTGPWSSLLWRHNWCRDVSNHRRLDCLFNRLFRRRSKKISKLCVTGLCEGNPSVTGEFSSQRASNAENASIWWRHHVFSITSEGLSGRVFSNSDISCTVIGY